MLLFSCPQWLLSAMFLCCIIVSMSRFFNFLAHNNIVPIALGLAILGTGSTYAAQNPERIYAVESRVVAIDNTYLVSVDLDDYTPTVKIVDVSEDEDAFYVIYDLYTIALVDSVWQDMIKTRTLTVRKETLADYRDLGAFVTTQLRQVVDREHTQLQKAQLYEKSHVSQKQIATSHRGLVGMFIDDKTETLPPHTETRERIPDPPPAVREAEQPKPAPEPRAEKDSERESVATGEQTDSVTDTPAFVPEVGDGTTKSETKTVQPYLSLLGKSTVELLPGATYKDMGVVVHDVRKQSPDLYTFVDGTMVDSVTIDTSTTARYTVRYVLSVDGRVVDEALRQIWVVAENDKGEAGQVGEQVSDTLDKKEEDSTENVEETVEEEVDEVKESDEQPEGVETGASEEGESIEADTASGTEGVREVEGKKESEEVSKEAELLKEEEENEEEVSVDSGGEDDESGDVDEGETGEDDSV